MKTKTYVKGVAALCALAAVACTGVQQSRGVWPSIWTSRSRLKSVSRTLFRG